MRISVVLAWWSLLLAVAACGAQPATDFQPTQLRGFARDTLTIERRDGRDTFRVWLALTPSEQQQGLMWIRELPRDQGMLFMLDAPRPMDMWMKNTYVSLDMVFFDAAGRISHIHRNATPLSEDIISSGGTVAGVLELLAGEAARRGIRTGDRILLPKQR
ncbi:MAG TPA: DUF192 domain-containing protein [Steroidobacteraceae bacterium]|nr:DUF192 domain-containing protein [Steroidobacteraceae bacterium]